MAKKYKKIEPVKFENRSRKSRCWSCGGTGIKDYTLGKLIKKWSGVPMTKCKACKGTGKWTEDFYYLHYIDKNGNHFCFGVDGIK